MQTAPRIAQFEKVSFEQFYKDFGMIYPKHFARMAWENIKLPTRATSGSAGYDFYLPVSCSFCEEDIEVPTGVRCKIEPGWVLVMCPKSGLGFKHGMHLINTMGVIDSDYYNSDNEGHIMFKGGSKESFFLEAGQKFVQGIFLPYGVTIDDATDGIRNGGFGSTGK